MSDCDVCIGVEDLDETYAESASAEKVARRECKCCECGSIIAKGQLHEHAIGRDTYWGEGENQRGWDRHRTCALCVDIRTVFTCGKSWYYGSLWDEIRDYAFDRLTTASPCFTKLSAPAKAFVLERWREWKGLA